MQNVAGKRPLTANGTGGGFISPAIRGVIARRAGELAGIALAMLGLALLIVLLSYNARDPSLNTATTRVATNLGGPAGAAIADFLLQCFGVAGALPSVALLAWAWRIGAARGFRHMTTRLVALVIAMPLLASALALPAALLHAGLQWPAGAGTGGAFGTVLSARVLTLGSATFGTVGAAMLALLLTGMAFLAVLATFGLSSADWRRVAELIRRAWRGIAAAGGRFGAMASRGVASAVGLARRRMPKAAPRPITVAPQPDTVVRREPRPGPVNVHATPSPDSDVAPALPAAQPPRLLRAVVKPRNAVAAAALAQTSLSLEEAAWRFPSMSLLKPAPARAQVGPSSEALERNARLLETVLSDYGVQGTIVEIRPGPVVTLYELEPAPGIRSARVIGLADDIARSLSVTAVRIATVSGRNVIGIEVPNSMRDTVYFSELLASEEWEKNSGKLVLALGKDIGGVPILTDLARMPHLMIAGTTGSGKSVGVNAMILSLLYRLSPDQCRLILIDPKMLELSVYDGIPHLMAPVVTEPAKAVVALKWTVREMERRYRAMTQLGVRNIAGYNERVAEARAKGEVVTRRVQTGFDPDTGRPTFEDQPLALETLPFIVVVVDEMADLMMVAGKEIEAAVQRLAQMARAAGIHVIMATQRPSVDVITGTIKANFPTRISFQVISKFDSRTILGEQGAEQLLGQGDMLFMQGGGRITRIHGPFVSDREVEEVVAFLRTQGEPAYVEEVTEAEANEDAPGGGGDIGSASDGEKGLFDQAVAVVAREGKASTSFIQRHLAIGYNRAAKLIEQMEKEGIVGPANHVGKREVLVRRAKDMDE